MVWGEGSGRAARELLALPQLQWRNAQIDLQGRSAALGFAKESGLVFEEGIVPNRFVGRTFIMPTQAARDRMVNLKLNIIGDLVKGKRLVVVDDSVVRGTTTPSGMIW